MADINDEKSFKEQYYQDWHDQSRFGILCDKLQEYYSATPSSMGNREAMTKWKEFRVWCKENGYTGKEINAAKRARYYDMD